MILYRVVSEAELAAYLKGQNIKPGKDCVPKWTGDLMTDIQEVMLKQKTVRVKEYGVGAYNKRNAYLRDWAFVWGRDYIHFEKGGIVPRLPGYDDLLEGEK